MKISVSRDAVADLERLKHFLEENDAPAARRAIAKLRTAIDSLSVFPERGRIAALKGFRELVVSFGRSAYIVRYVFRRADDAVVIVRIWHGREQRD